MPHRLLTGAVIVLAGALALAPPAHAQQTLNLTLGRFTPFGEDARAPGDTLVENRTFLHFDLEDFNGPTIGGEWLVGLGDFVEAGAGISFSRRTVPSVYQDFVDSDGTEVDQDLRLRLVPVSFTVRALPLGQFSPVQPYIGVGVSLVNWRYSETGEFIDFASGLEIFRDSFTASGTARGPVVLGGIRFAGDSASIGGEIRYHKAEAELDAAVFSGPTLDLGGWTYNITLGVRF